MKRSLSLSAVLIVLLALAVPANALPVVLGGSPDFSQHANAAFTN